MATDSFLQALATAAKQFALTAPQGAIDSYNARFNPAYFAQQQEDRRQADQLAQQQAQWQADQDFRRQQAQAAQAQQALDNQYRASQAQDAATLHAIQYGLTPAQPSSGVVTPGPNSQPSGPSVQDLLNLGGYTGPITPQGSTHTQPQAGAPPTPQDLANLGGYTGPLIGRGMQTGQGDITLGGQGYNVPGYNVPGAGGYTLSTDYLAKHGLPSDKPLTFANDKDAGEFLLKLHDNEENLSTKKAAIANNAAYLQRSTPTVLANMTAGIAQVGNSPRYQQMARNFRQEYLDAVEADLASGKIDKSLAVEKKYQDTLDKQNELQQRAQDRATADAQRISDAAEKTATASRARNQAEVNKLIRPLETQVQQLDKLDGMIQQAYTNPEMQAILAPRFRSLPLDSPARRTCR